MNNQGKNNHFYGKKHSKKTRFLTKKEIVHHLNGIRNDNRLKNLHLLSSKKEHHTKTLMQILQKRILSLESKLKNYEILV